MALKKNLLSSPEHFNENHTGLKFPDLFHGNLNKNILIEWWFQTTCAKITVNEFLGFRVSKYFNSHFINHLKYMY